MSKPYGYDDVPCSGCYDGCSDCADEPQLCAQCGKIIKGDAEFETAEMLPICSEKCFDKMEEEDRA